MRVSLSVRGQFVNFDKIVAALLGLSHKQTPKSITQCVQAFFSLAEKRRVAASTRRGRSDVKKLLLGPKWLHFIVFQSPDLQECPLTLTTVLSWRGRVIRRRFSGLRRCDVVALDQVLLHCVAYVCLSLAMGLF